MTARTNQLGQQIGFDVPDWTRREAPQRSNMEGQYCRLEPISADEHAGDLLEAFRTDKDDRIWTYLPYGPLTSEEQIRNWIALTCSDDDPLFHTIIENSSGKAVGVASFLRIDPSNGVIEVGNINYSPLLQRTTAATEAMFLMMKRAFDELDYRRYEWKCDSLNGPSCRAAKRLGFRYDGLFPKAVIYKGRNRDTAWFSILDTEWPEIRAAFEKWLRPDNFSSDGSPKTSLSDLTAKRENVRPSVSF